jgi:hypothetical protein
LRIAWRSFRSLKRDRADVGLGWWPGVSPVVEPWQGQSFADNDPQFSEPGDASRRQIDMLDVRDLVPEPGKPYVLTGLGREVREFA